MTKKKLAKIHVVYGGIFMKKLPQNSYFFYGMIGLLLISSLWFYFWQIKADPVNSSLTFSQKLKLAIVKTLIVGIAVGGLPLPSIAKENNEVPSSLLHTRGGSNEDSSKKAASSSVVDGFPINPRTQGHGQSSPSKAQEGDKERIFGVDAKRKKKNQSDESTDGNLNQNSHSIHKNNTVFNRVNDYLGLKSEEETARQNQDVNKDIEKLINKLSGPQKHWGYCDHSGIGNIWYLKTRNGARVYYRIIGPNTVEILGIAAKHRQNHVRDLLTEYYGKTNSN